MSGRGRLVWLVVTTGQRGDAPQAAALTAAPRPRWLLADAAHDSDAVRAAARATGARACIRPNPARTRRPRFDRLRYRNRNVAERSFRRLKGFRRVATRYEKKAANVLGMAWPAAFTINSDIHTA